MKTDFVTKVAPYILEAKLQFDLPENIPAVWPSKILFDFLQKEVLAQGQDYINGFELQGVANVTFPTETQVLANVRLITDIPQNLICDSNGEVRLTN
jgi:hypothetical protein